jgi:membrane fusion protein (multidrug efflux system)
VAQRDAAKNQLDITVSKGRADIAAAKAKAQQAVAALDYARANAAQKPAYQQNLAALRAAVDAAQADLRSSQAQRADTVLASPMDGFVTARTMDPGSMATPGQPILTLQAIRQVWVSIPVPEEDSHKIRMGEVGTVAFDAFPDQKFEGRVSQINTSADPSSRQFTVRLTLDNPKGQIRPGMFGHVSLETERAAGVIAVPREALQKSREGGSQVVVVDSSGTVHLRPVTEGPSDPEYVSIASGLEAGEKVVTLNSAPLKDGAKVRFGGRGGGSRGGAGGGGARGSRPGGPPGA